MIRPLGLTFADCFGTAALDLIICTLLCYSLWRARRDLSFSFTKSPMGSVLSSIVRLSLSTCLFTTSLAISSAILLEAGTGAFWGARRL